MERSEALFRSASMAADSEGNIQGPIDKGQLGPHIVQRRDGGATEERIDRLFRESH